MLQDVHPSGVHTHLSCPTGADRAATAGHDFNLTSQQVQENFEDLEFIDAKTEKEYLTAFVVPQVSQAWSKLFLQNKFALRLTKPLQSVIFLKICRYWVGGSVWAGAQWIVKMQRCSCFKYRQEVCNGNALLFCNVKI